MLNKNIMMIAILLVSLLAVSAVSATDNATSDVVSVDETTVDVVKDTNEDVVSVENDHELLDYNDDIVSNPVENFTKLSMLVENTPSKGSLELNNDYKYNSDSHGVISINKEITINGNNHEINANKFSSIFTISSKNVVLKNIKFTNGIAEEYGGAIYAHSGYLTLINCSFINNTSPYAGALYLLNDNNRIINCTFINNKAYYYDGAIRITSGADNNDLINCTFINNNGKSAIGAIGWHGKNGNLINCTFSNNVAGGYGTAIAWFGTYGNIVNCKFINHAGESIIYWTEQAFGSKLINSTFINNSIGNSVVWSSIRGLIDNCLFINNSANSNGGAIYLVGDECILKDSIFQDNYAMNGGAIYWAGNEGTLSKCSFIKNSASISKNEGGAIKWIGENGKIIDCDFINNYAYGGSAIALYGDNSLLNNCSFIDNYGYGAAGAIYFNAAECILNNSYFKNNFASQLAGAIFLTKNNNNIENCTFVNNSANDGGAILIQGNNTVLKQDLFINNNASRFGGALYWLSSDGILTNSSFNNNCATNGGSIFWQGNNGEVNDCSFIDNYAQNNGSSIYWYGNNGNLKSSIITDNIQSNQIYWWNTENGNIENCKFINNTNGVINKGAKFSRNNISLSYSNTSFDFKNPKPISVSLENVSDDYLISSDIIFNFVKNDNVMVFDINLSNNCASICNELSDLDAGIWNVTAIFTGDDNYAPCNVTFTITIKPIFSSLNIILNNAYVGKETILTVNVGDRINSTINEGVVTFFNGKTNIGEANIENNVATLSYAPSTVGEHLITAIFNSTNYLGSNCTVKMLVDSASVEVLVDQGTVGYETNFIANVKGLYTIINEGTVAFYIDNKYLGDVPVVEGFASLVYTPLTAGEYTVKAVFRGSDKFLDDENTMRITVKKAESNVIIDDLNGTVGHEVTIIANVVSPNNLIINEGSIVFFDGSTQIGEANVKKGVASLIYTPTTAGKHIITSIYNADNYLPSNATSTFTVEKLPTTISASVVSTVYNGGKYLNVTLKDQSGKKIDCVKLSVVLNGNTYTPTTDANGQAMVSTNGLAPKTYTATITFAGNSNYDKSTIDVNVIVKKATPSITASQKNFEPTVKTKKYSIILKDNNKKPMKKTSVSIKVNGKTYNAKTDSKGVATFNLKKLTKKGTYKAVITYKGNANYNKVTKKVTITVKPTPKITAKAATFKKSVKTKKYTITLKDNKNKVMKKTKVSLKVNGKTFKATTNAKGKATFKITKLTKKGTYKAVVSFTGNKNFNKATKKVNIKVK